MTYLTFIEKTNHFYQLMGPLFADKLFIKELDCQLYDKPKSIWVICTDNQENVIGFVSLMIGDKIDWLDNLYVYSRHRNCKIGRELIDRIIIYQNKPIRLITCNQYAYKLFVEKGFVKTGTCGKYVKLILNEKKGNHEKTL
jgi:hypothetical protein